MSSGLYEETLAVYAETLAARELRLSQEEVQEVKVEAPEEAKVEQEVGVEREEAMVEQEVKRVYIIVAGSPSKKKVICGFCHTPDTAGKECTRLAEGVFHELLASSSPFPPGTPVPFMDLPQVKLQGNGYYLQQWSDSMLPSFSLCALRQDTAFWLFKSWRRDVICTFSIHQLYELPTPAWVGNVVTKRILEQFSKPA